MTDHASISSNRQLQRYGIHWSGPEQPISTPMADGYWTPWHEAQAEIERLTRELADAQSTNRREYPKAVAERDRLRATLEYVLSYSHLLEDAPARKWIVDAVRKALAGSPVETSGLQCKGSKCPEPHWCQQEGECLWDRWNKPAEAVHPLDAALHEPGNCRMCGRSMTGVDSRLPAPSVETSPEPQRPLSEKCPKCGNQMYNWPRLMTKCNKCLHEWYMDSTGQNG